MDQSTQAQDINVDKAIQHLKSVLVSGETLDAWAFNFGYLLWLTGEY